MPLDIDMVGTRDMVVVRCRGRLVLGDGADSFHEAALSVLAKGSVVLLDFNAVNQIDACGVGILAELCAAAMRTGCALGLFGAGDRVRRVLRLTRLDGVMPDWSDPSGVAHRAQIELASA